MAHQTEVWTIWCVLEDELSMFPIQVASNSPVGILKNKIKDAKNALAKFDADHLELYQVEISVHDDLEKSVEAKLSKNPTKLDAWLKLAAVFKDGPKDNVVHIVVKAPGIVGIRKTKPSPLLDDGDVELLLNTTLEPQLEAVLSVYLAKDTPLPIWQPMSDSEEMRSHISEEMHGHISGLQIPRRSHSSSPSLLLHGLGQPSHDTLLIERVNKLFGSGSRHKILCNTSGSGKTRLLLEGLWRRWGLYFTARTLPDGIGSQDLEKMLEALQSEERLIAITAENHTTALDANREVTSRRFLLVFYVRVLVLRVFLQRASMRPGGIKEEHKQRWLLLQVAPELLSKSDIFLKLTRELQQAPLSYLESSIKSELDEIHSLLGKSVVLHCVLDEAQVPANMSSNCFRSEKNWDQPRPLLRQIIRSWRSWLPNLIISGTGVSMQNLEIVFGSAVAKEGELEPETFTNLGAFDNENAQWAYLKKYLPPDALDTQHWREVASRARYWLHGRYRFTATYISRLIQANFCNPHEVLDNFVADMTGFRPSDRGHGGGVTARVAKVNPFDFSKLTRDEALLRQIAGFIFDYVFHGKPRDLGGPNIEKLVEYGFARFAFHKDVIADEPLALLAAVEYFSKTVWSLPYFLLEAVTSPHDSARGSAFEHFAAYVLGTTFKSPIPLSDVFNFVGQVSRDLEDEIGELVAMEKAGGRFQCYSVDISSNTGPTYRLGHTCKTNEETLAWLRNPQRTALCYPANKVGPDLILVLRLSDGSLVRVLIQFKQRFDSTMSRKKIADALGTTDPNQFDSPRSTLPPTVQTTDNSSTHSYVNYPKTSKGLLQQALLSLGTGTKKAGHFSVLRVLMTYPTSPNLQILAEIADEDEDRHPAATVDMEKLAKGNDAQRGYLESLKLRLQDATIRRKRKAHTLD